MSLLLSILSYWGVAVCSDPLVAYLLLVIGSIFGAVVFHGTGIGEVSDKKAVMVYLIVQVLGSSFVLASCGVNSVELGRAFLSFAFLIKVGLFPFHWWVYYVFSCLRWKAFGPGLVFMKFGLVMSFPVLMGWWFYLVVCTGSFFYMWVGVVSEGKGGNLKSIVSWMSVGDSCWSLLGKMMSLQAALVYFFSSGLTLQYLSWVLSREGLAELSSLSLCKDPWSVLFGLWSYAGFPPLLGSVAKLYVVDELISYTPEGVGVYLSLWGMLMSLITMSVVGRYLAAVLLMAPKYNGLSNKILLQIGSMLILSYGLFFFV
uniref:NADH dehydrogenase subunit 2 n=1 Tax=Pinctada albina TaxID=315487 RepID=A0A1S5UZM4_9BIVA|nr:NADH dehydrogenase subunit 2 [Pinctada albina]